MIRVSRAVVVRQVARIAVLGCTGEVSTRVALTTLQAVMSTRQRKLRLRVIENSACPRCCRMALRAISGEARLLMIRICRAVVQRDVTSAAVRRRVGEGSVRMTLSTLHCTVRARQRERCFRVIERRARPVCRAVAN